MKQHKKNMAWENKEPLHLRSMHFIFLIAISQMWEQLVARELMAIDFS